jgi:chromosome segregation ATPase
MLAFNHLAVALLLDKHCWLLPSLLDVYAMSSQLEEQRTRYEAALAARHSQLVETAKQAASQLAEKDAIISIKDAQIDRLSQRVAQLEDAAASSVDQSLEILDLKIRLAQFEQATTPTTAASERTGTPQGTRVLTGIAKS